MRERSIRRRIERRTQLVDPSGQPIASKTSTAIPFIRYMPNPAVPKSLQEIDRGAKVYAQAIQFIARGGRYACRITPEGDAELVAGFPVKGGAEGEMVMVAQERVANGPAILPAVDRLVKASVQNMDAVILGESHAKMETMQ